jgi:hypothetical protein
MRTILILIAVVTAGGASTPLEAIVTEQKLVGWKVASQHDQGRGKGTIVELIPASESIDKWQHLAAARTDESPTPVGAQDRTVERIRC